MRYIKRGYIWVIYTYDDMIQITPKFFLDPALCFKRTQYINLDVNFSDSKSKSDGLLVLRGTAYVATSKYLATPHLGRKSRKQCAIRGMCESAGFTELRTRTWSSPLSPRFIDSLQRKWAWYCTFAHADCAYWHQRDAKITQYSVYF